MYELLQTSNGYFPQLWLCIRCATTLPVHLGEKPWWYPDQKARSRHGVPPLSGQRNEWGPPKSVRQYIVPWFWMFWRSNIHNLQNQSGNMLHHVQERAVSHRFRASQAVETNKSADESGVQEGVGWTVRRRLDDGSSVSGYIMRNMQFLFQVVELSSQQVTGEPLTMHVFLDILSCHEFSPVGCPDGWQEPNLTIPWVGRPGWRHGWPMPPPCRAYARHGVAEWAEPPPKRLSKQHLGRQKRDIRVLAPHSTVPTGGNHRGNRLLVWVAKMASPFLIIDEPNVSLK